MDSHAISNAVERQDWLEPVADTLSGAVESAFEGAGEPGRTVQNLLHGTWLGHPLHPVLTDVPVGAWTVAAVLDAAEASGRKELRRAADAAVAVGLVGALGAATTGLTDWHNTDGGDRRVGVAHGLLNVSATLLYATSWMLRQRGQRETARGLA